MLHLDTKKLLNDAKKENEQIKKENRTKSSQQSLANSLVVQSTARNPNAGTIAQNPAANL